MIALGWWFLEKSVYASTPLTMNQKGLLPFVEQIVQLGVVGESATAFGDGLPLLHSGSNHWMHRVRS